MKIQILRNEKSIIYLISIYLIDTYLRVILGQILLPWNISLFIILISFIILYSYSNVNIDLTRWDLKIILIFCILMFFTCFINNSFSIETNQIFLFQSIWFFIFYAYISSIKNKATIELVKNLIFWLTFLILTVYSIIILCTIFINSLPTTSFIPFKIPVHFDGTRVAGIINNANITGQLAFVAILSSIYLLKFKKIKICFFFLTFIINLCIVIVTDCRSAQISFIIFLITYFHKNIISYFENCDISKKIIIITFMSILVVTIFIKITRIDILNIKVIESYDFERLLNDITSSRYEIWKEALYLVSKSPFYGLGVGNLINSAKKFIGPLSIIVQRSYFSTHNLITEVMYSCGLIGLLLIISIFFFIFKMIKTLLNEKKDILLETSIVISILIVSFLDNAILFNGPFITPLFWFNCGLIANKYYEFSRNN